MCVVVVQKIEARVAADEDLKLADLLKYYLRESQAAKVCVIHDLIIMFTLTATVSCPSNRRTVCQGVFMG